MYYRISGEFDCDFNLTVWRFFLNREAKVTVNTVFKRHCGNILWQFLANPPS